MPLLLTISFSKNPRIRELVLYCISGVCDTNEISPHVMNKNVYKRLISLLTAEEPISVQEEAALSLGHIAKDRNFFNVTVAGMKLHIRRDDGMKALVKLLNTPDPDTKKNVSFALHTLLDDCKDLVV